MSAGTAKDMDMSLGFLACRHILRSQWLTATHSVCVCVCACAQGGQPDGHWATSDTMASGYNCRRMEGRGRETGSHDTMSKAFLVLPTQLFTCLLTDGTLHPASDFRLDTGHPDASCQCSIAAGIVEITGPSPRGVYYKPWLEGNQVQLRIKIISKRHFCLYRLSSSRPKGLCKLCQNYFIATQLCRAMFC